MSVRDSATLLLAHALMIPERDVPADARLGRVDQWDSLAHARVLLAIEERLGRMLTPDEAVAIESIADIAQLLESKR